MDEAELPAPLRERYRDFEVLGQGSAGIVLGARDSRLERKVAIKLLRSEAAASPEWRRRFLAEASLTARIKSPRVAEVFDAGEAGGAAWLVLEFLPAGSLADRRVAAGGRLPPPEALAYFEQVLEGLAAAHAAGIVHRDLKAENVLLGADGGARVADFGLARDLDGASATRTGTILGTIHAMAPEQMCGARTDPRWDVYAAGILAWELIAGRGPFPDSDYATLLLAKQKGPAAGLRAEGFELPPAADQLIVACLAPAPERRPKDAGLALARLRAASSGSLETSRATLAPGLPRPGGTLVIPAGPAPGAAAPAPRRAPGAVAFVVGSVLVGAALLAGRPAVPDPQARSGPDAAPGRSGDPEAVEAPALQVAAAAEADPQVQALLALGPTAEPAARRETWEAARLALAGRLAPLLPTVGSLEPGAVATRPRLVDALSRLRILAELVERRRPLDTGPPVGLRAEHPLVRALSQALRCAPDYTLFIPDTAPPQWHVEALSRLNVPGQEWTTVRAYEDLLKQRREGTARISRVDWFGTPFSTLPDTGAVAAVGSMVFESEYNRVIGMPEAAVFPLVPTGGRDLVLATAVSRIGDEDVLRLTLEVPEGPRRTLCWIPTGLRPDRSSTRKEGQRLTLAAALVPPEGARLMIQALGIQALGSSGSVAEVHEVFQRVAQDPSTETRR